jgi:hypothetical protein
MSESPDPLERDFVPVACTLKAEDVPTGLQRWQQLQQRAAPVTHLREGVLEVQFEGAPSIHDEHLKTVLRRSTASQHSLE